jgi:hypothetical protein
LYALNNLIDIYLASVSVVYAACCVSVIILTMVKRRGHRRGTAGEEASALRPACSLQPGWLGPRWGVALAGGAAISVGPGAGGMAPDVSRLLDATAACQASEIAVSDTPFEDEPFPASAKTAATVAPVREVRPLPLNKTQFEGKRVPKSQKGEGP